MEDAHATILDLQPESAGKDPKTAPPDKRLAFFGVYDGHGGDKVALFAGEHIHKIVAKQEAFAKGNIEQALKDGFLATDRAILNGMRVRIGCFIGTTDSCCQILNMRRRCPDVQLQWAFCRRTRYGLYVSLRVSSFHNLLKPLGERWGFSNGPWREGPYKATVIRP